MKTILYAESSGICGEFKELLSRETGTEVISVQTGLDAIKYLFQHPLPGIIIIDSNIQNPSGSLLLDYIKTHEEFKKVFVIVYAALINKSTAIFFQSADRFFPKDSSLFSSILQEAVNVLHKYNAQEDDGSAGRENNRSSQKSDQQIQEEITALRESKDRIDLLSGRFIKSFSEYMPQEKLETELCAFFKDNFGSGRGEGNNHGLEKLTEAADRVRKDNVEMLAIQKETFLLNRLFTSFMPQKTIDMLLRKQQTASLMTGEKRNVTVLFCHIKDFTRIEKAKPPEEIISFLNQHFSILSEIIKKKGGEINKYIGDAVFAMFGAPESYPNNEERALCAARAMRAAAEVPIQIGIHSGKAIIGNIGSSDNFDYTAIGDAVNLAARLESLNKFYGTDILLSDTFVDHAAKQCGEAAFLEIDCVAVKGKTGAVKIFTTAPETMSGQETAEYLKGLAMFRLGNWHTGLEYFKKCDRSKTIGRIIEIYMKRCSDFIITPPEQWNGSVVLNFK